MKKMEIIMDHIVKVGGFAEPQGEFPQFGSTNMSVKSEFNG
jgi:hypothetical protein